MSGEKSYDNGRWHSAGEQFEVRLTNPMLYDRLCMLSAEYSVPMELLVNVAVKRLVEDVDFVRRLRIGEVEEA